MVIKNEALALILVTVFYNRSLWSFQDPDSPGSHPDHLPVKEVKKDPRIELFEKAHKEYFGELKRFNRITLNLPSYTYDESNISILEERIDSYEKALSFTEILVFKANLLQSHSDELYPGQFNFPAQVAKNVKELTDKINYESSIISELKKTKQTYSVALPDNSKDDFWSGVEKTGVVSTNKYEQDDFWLGAETSNRSVNATYDGLNKTQAIKNDNDQSDFWVGHSNSSSSQPDELAQESYEIKTNDEGQTGVVGKNGAVLIPFRNWKIISFKSGFARVKKTLDLKVSEFKCIREGYAWDKFYAGANFHEEGFVEQSGEWIIKPDRFIDTWEFRRKDIYLCVDKCGGTSSAERTFYRNCKRKSAEYIERLEEQYKQQGYKSTKSSY